MKKNNINEKFFEFYHEEESLDWANFFGHIEVISKDLVFNFDIKETKVFYNYFYKHIFFKYVLNENIFSTRTIVIFGFIIYCHKKGLYKLRDKAYLIINESKDNPLKDFLIFIYENYKTYLDGAINFEGLKEEVDHMTYLAYLNGELYNEYFDRTDNSPNDLCLNVSIFLFEIIDDEKFSNACFDIDKNSEELAEENYEATLDWINNYIDEIPKGSHVKKKHIDNLNSKIWQSIQNPTQFENDADDDLPF